MANPIFTIFQLDFDIFKPEIPDLARKLRLVTVRASPGARCDLTSKRVKCPDLREPKCFAVSQRNSVFSQKITFDPVVNLRQGSTLFSGR